MCPLLQESYARQVLPCLDEPAYRAEFNLAVEVCHGAFADSRLPCCIYVQCSTTYFRSLSNFSQECVHHATMCGALVQVPPPMSALSTMPQLRSANTDKGLKLVRLRWPSQYLSADVVAWL